MMGLLTRRGFLSQSLAAAGCFASNVMLGQTSNVAPRTRASLCITFDLEMSAHYPSWGDTHWNFEKGNLNTPTKDYTVQAGERIRSAGGKMHCFCVGRVLEQENIEWLKAIALAGHPIGNHTYDHVNVTATRPVDLQFRFQRSPWLLRGQTPADAIRENIRLTTAALKSRLGIDNVGFRTPGGFAQGLANHPEVRLWLRELGFTWISSLYPTHPMRSDGKRPTASDLEALLPILPKNQPFTYPGDGLVELPMTPISDVHAFRAHRWKLDWFLDATRVLVDWSIAHGAVHDFLGHPSCLYVVDPQFRILDQIIQQTQKAGGHAELVGLDTVANRWQAQRAAGASPLWGRTSKT